MQQQITTSKIETKYRKIILDQLPGPKSMDLLERLKKSEPITSINQLPVGISRSYGINIEDVDGNVFLDGSSGVVVTNIGHTPEISRQMIKEQADLFHYAYSFPFEKRVELTQKLVQISPDNIDQVLLLTTGSEATEAAIKIARKYNQVKYGPEKRIVIGFKSAFHGKTMGAQMAGGIDNLKTWIGYQDPGLIQIEFPYCYRCWKGRNQYSSCTDDCLDLLRDQFQKNPGRIAAVMTETFLGRDLVFAPNDFFKGVQNICRENEVLLIFDEIQAGFGRLGCLFGFEHYGVKPNLICCGKGISSGMPLSALLGEYDIMNCFGEGEMTTTHSADPISVAATIANITKLIEDNMAVISNSKKMEELFRMELNRLQGRYSCIGNVRGKGLIWGLDIVKDPETREPYEELANKIHLNMYKRGVLLKVPRGVGHNIININPPLIISRDAAQEILQVLDESINEAIEGK